MKRRYSVDVCKIQSDTHHVRETHMKDHQRYVCKAKKTEMSHEIKPFSFYVHLQ